MKLSVENINQASPYWVIQLDDLTFRFATDSGVAYRIGFYKDTVFLIDGSYHFFIDNVNHQPSPNAPKLLATVTAVIEEFFRQEPLVMLYICDPSDNRQSSRNRLYKRWFNKINSSFCSHLTEIFVPFNKVLSFGNKNKTRFFLYFPHLFVPLPPTRIDIS